MKKGFTFFFRGKDVFFVTERKNKVPALAREIIRGLINAGYDVPDAPSVISDILYGIRPAELEEKLIKGKTWYKIHGVNFGIISPEEDIVIM